MARAKKSRTPQPTGEGTHPPAAEQVRRQLLARQGTTLDDRLQLLELREAVASASQAKKPAAQRALERFGDALSKERAAALEAYLHPPLPDGRIRLRPSGLRDGLRTLPESRSWYGYRCACRCCCCCGCKPEGDGGEPGDGSEPEPEVPTGCFTLAPLPLNLHEVFLMVPSQADNNTVARCSQGHIGLLDICTTAGMFTNNNEGTKVGYVEQPFRGTAPATGVGQLDRPDAILSVDFMYSLTGDLIGQAGDNRPDSALEVTAEVDIVVENDRISLTSSNLLNAETIGNGVQNTISQTLTLPGSATLDLHVDDRVEYVARLRINSWSSRWGVVLLFVRQFGLVTNSDDIVHVCY